MHVRIYETLTAAAVAVLAVSLPILTAGSAFAREASDDSTERVEDVEESAGDSTEGEQVNPEDEAWTAALSLDRRGEAGRALEQYGRFVDSYPDSPRVPTALERISALRAEAAAAERALAESAKQEAFAYANVVRAVEPEQVLWHGERYLADFPEGPNSHDVRKRIESASAEIAAANLAERRESVGKAQRVWGVAIMTLAGTAGVAGGILGGVTLSEYNDLEGNCGETAAGCSQDVRDENFTKAVFTDGLLGFAVVAAAAGIIVYLTAPSWEDEPPEDEQPAVTAGAAPAADGRGAVVGVSVQF